MPRSNPQRYIDQVAVWAGGISLRCVFFYHVLSRVSTPMEDLPDLDDHPALTRAVELQEHDALPGSQD